MIMTVEELKQRITANKPDEVLKEMLDGIEMFIRNYTNNNFQHRGFRTVGTIEDGKLYLDAAMFKVGDTIQISESHFNEGLYVVSEIEGDVVTLPGALDETDVLVTKVVYPPDVKMGVANMIQWDLQYRPKVGVQSETISRHTVMYFNMANECAAEGYPKAVLGFLKQYRKARF